VIKGIHHPGIVVADLDLAQQFYCEVLGFEFVSEFSWDKTNTTINQIIGLDKSAAVARLLRCRTSYLELFEFESPDQTAGNRHLGAHEPGIRHICFEVDDAFAEFNKVKQFDEELVMNEPVSFESGGSAVYCRDPFGNIIEFTTAGRGFPSLKQLSDPIVQADLDFP